MPSLSHKSLFIDVFTNQHIHKGLPAFVLDEAFADRQHLRSFVEDDVCCGRIPRPQKLSLFQQHSRLDFKLNGTSFGNALGGDVLKGCRNLAPFNCADCQSDGHAFVQLLDLALVNFPHKLEIRHVRHRRDGGAFVEIVGFDDAVALFDGHFQDHAGNR